MEYIFTDAPIVSRRVDRRTHKQKRIAQERRQAKFDRFSELFSMQEMIDMGFYNCEPKLLPHGIEIWNRHCTLRDKSSNFEWYELEVPTLALCLPKMERLHQVERLSPSYWEESKTFYWAFKQRQKVVVYCILDLISRLIYLPHWEKVSSIPVKWMLGNERCLLFAKEQIEKINNGSFDLQFECHFSLSDRPIS